MQQRRVMPDRSEKVWTVNINALRDAFPRMEWLKQARLVERDLKQMSDYLPHWLLTGGKNGEPLRSKCCKDNIAPIEGCFRCILCNEAATEKPNSLMWTGLLPVNLEGREKALQKIERAIEKGKLKYPIVAPGGKRHLLIPVSVEYPQNWPFSPPTAFYVDRQYLDSLDIRGSNFNIHMLGDRQLCLYHAAQWNDNTTIMHVIANRVAPHAFALLRLANGEESIKFFVTDYGYGYDR